MAQFLVTIHDGTTDATGIVSAADVATITRDTAMAALEMAADAAARGTIPRLLRCAVENDAAVLVAKFDINISVIER